MTEKEKKEFYVATCKCCLLAEAMKTCPACQFNIGLAHKTELVDTTPVLIPIPMAAFALSEVL